MYVEQCIVVLSLLGGVLFGLAAFLFLYGEHTWRCQRQFCFYYSCMRFGWIDGRRRLLRRSD